MNIKRKTVTILTCGLIGILTGVLLFPGVFLAGHRGLKDRFSDSYQVMREKARDVLKVDLKELGVPCPYRGDTGRTG